MDRRPLGRILAGTMAFALAAGMPLAVGTVMVGAAAPAVGQVLPVSAWYAAIDTDEAMLRCGHGDLMYPVAALKRGQVLRVDGEGQGWARVSYPPGVPAFVPADSVQVDTATRTATLTKSTRLKAFNKTTGLRGSWKDVLDQPLPAGTRLIVMDAESTPDGRGNSAWRVQPPENARAFVPLSALRRATEEEVTRHTEAMSTAPQAVVIQQAPRTPERQAPGITVEGSRQGSAMPPVAPGSPVEQPQQAAVEPAKVERPAVVLPPSPYEGLEAAFVAVRNADPATAEFTELKREFEKAIAALDDSPGSQAVRLRLQQRAAFLELRAELQAELRALAEAQASFSEEDELLAARLAEVDRVRQYTLVGRLSASTIYDGVRLPLMYRIQTVGGAAPRTLAYVKPDETLNIDARLGQIVGVLGDSTMDPALRLNVIVPTRVDALEATATAVVVPDSDN